MMPTATYRFREEYRYQFNSKEVENEVNGDYDYGFRIYDPRLGRFLSVDPLFRDFPWFSPYQFAGNNPIWAKDLDGLEVDKCFDPKNCGRGAKPPVKLSLGKLRLPVKITKKVITEAPLEIHGNPVHTQNQDFVQQFDVPDANGAKVEFNAYNVPDAIIIKNAETGEIIGGSDGKEIKGRKVFEIPKGVGSITVEVTANEKVKKDREEGKNSSTDFEVNVVSKEQTQTTIKKVSILGIVIKRSEKTKKVTDEEVGTETAKPRKTKLTIKQIKKI